MPLAGAFPGTPMCIWRASAPSTWLTGYGRQGSGDTASAAETPTVTKQEPAALRAWGSKQLPAGQLSAVVTDDTGDRNLYLIAQVAASRSG